MKREIFDQELNEIKQRLIGSRDARLVLDTVTHLVEKVVSDSFSEALPFLEASGSKVTLLATGGFGRRELHPHSDVDIILLFENPLVSGDEKFLRAFLHPLWDLGLNIGQHVLQLGHYDFEVRNLELATALLDIRYIAGEYTIFDFFKSRELPRVLSGRKKEILKALIASNEERHKRFNETIYQLEPDIKDAPGGLRDFQLSRWIGRILYDLERLEDYPDQDLLRTEELSRILDAQQFLLLVRNHLHFITGRNRNVLSHDLQVEIAGFLGYTGEGSHAVERLMKDYFLRAKSIYGLRESMMRRAFPPTRKAAGSLQSPHWSTTLVRRGALGFPNEAAIVDHPANMLKLFYRSAKYQIPVSEQALDQVKKHLNLIDEETRSSSEVRDLFLKLLKQTRGIYQSLVLMHEIGLLGAIFPEFDRIRCHVIQDFFHKYTVDEHSLLTIKNLEDLYHTRKPKERRFAEILKALPRPDLVLFSMLFHDVGKADPGNHCENSLRAIDTIAGRFRISEEETSTIQFLVQNHLEMSATFQRRDITDESVIKRFADFVGSQENLRMLCLVTYADIKAVSSEALTPWKADLLWQLYVETEAQLTRQFADDRWRTQADGNLLQEVATQLGSASEAYEDPLQAFLDGFPRRYLRFTPKKKIAEHFRLSEKLKTPNDVAFKLVRYRSTYELSLMAFDRPFLFADLTGVLSYFGMNILRGQAFANTGGVILDIIEFEDELQTFKLNKSEIESFRSTLQRVLRGEESLTQLLRRRESSILFQRKHKGSVATFINFDDHSSEKYTIVEIVTRDRYGLLSTIARTLAQNGCNIEVALITTEGNRAIDVFYLTKGGCKLDQSAEKSLSSAMISTLDVPPL